MLQLANVLLAVVVRCVSRKLSVSLSRKEGGEGGGGVRSSKCTFLSDGTGSLREMKRGKRGVESVFVQLLVFGISGAQHHEPREGRECEPRRSSERRRNRRHDEALDAREEGLAAAEHLPGQQPPSGASLADVNVESRAALEPAQAQPQTAPRRKRRRRERRADGGEAPPAADVDVAVPEEMQQQKERQCIQEPPGPELEQQNVLDWSEAACADSDSLEDYSVERNEEPSRPAPAAPSTPPWTEELRAKARVTLLPGKAKPLARAAGSGAASCAEPAVAKPKPRPERPTPEEMARTEQSLQQRPPLFTYENVLMREEDRRWPNRPRQWGCIRVRQEDLPQHVQAMLQTAGAQPQAPQQ